MNADLPRLSPRIRDLFEAVVNVEFDERGAWLAAHCADFSDRITVERLLAADEVKSNVVIDHAFSHLLARIDDMTTATFIIGVRSGDVSAA